MDNFLDLLRYLWAPLMAFFGWAFWSFKKATISRDEVNEMMRGMTERDRRIAKLEAQVATKEDVAELRNEIHQNQLKITASDVRQDTQLTSIVHALARVENYLLEKTK